MKIGIAFDLKPDEPLPLGAPDDLHEEFDSPVTIRAIGDVLRGLGRMKEFDIKAWVNDTEVAGRDA